MGTVTADTFNAFFMTMRGKFTTPGTSIHYYVVQFDPDKVHLATESS